MATSLKWENILFNYLTRGIDMGEIYEFSNKSQKEIETLIEKFSEEYDDLEDQLLDLEDFMPDEDDEQEYSLWKEEYSAIEKRMAEIEKEYDKLQKEIL